MVKEKVKHLEESDRERVTDLFEGITIIASSLNDLHPCIVPTLYNIDLASYAPIASKMRKGNPKHDTGIWEQLMRMLDARMITRSTSP